MKVVSASIRMCKDLNLWIQIDRKCDINNASACDNDNCTTDKIAKLQASIYVSIEYSMICAA